MDTHQIQQLINTTISERTSAEEPKELYEPIGYMMSLGGKRLRPTLLLLSTDLFGGSILGSMDAALAIELFHNFTLMHDDIMDRSPLRRGHPTVHEKWNEPVAILSGDVMLVQAYRMLTAIPEAYLKTVMLTFNEVAENVCRGQQMDMNFEQAENVSLSQYLEMIRLKTAVLLGGSMKIGAVLGGASTEQAGLLYEFGEHLGLAFQLQDDILDVFGDQQKFGKKKGGDILANKKTWLLIKSLELAEGLDEEELNFWLNAGDPGEDEKVAAITGIYTRLGIRSLAEEEMNDHAEKALRALEAISAPQEKKNRLRQFAGLLLVREN
jgi:geranylgeranyl diphosphate synthase type II